MDARNAPHEGWVTVADAAKALSAAGDLITAPNISRYLDRALDIPTEKKGKFRWVDLGALAAHRGTNILVGEKRAARGLEDEPGAIAAQLPLAPRAPAAEADDEDADDTVGGASKSSAINQANLRLKELAIRAKEREELIELGDLVPLPDVVALLSETFTTFIGELEREEASVALTLGRDAAAEFRRARKAAQQAASDTLVRVARERLKPLAVEAATEAQPELPGDLVPEPAAAAA